MSDRHGPAALEHQIKWPERGLLQGIFDCNGFHFDCSRFRKFSRTEWLLNEKLPVFRKLQLSTLDFPK